MKSASRSSFNCLDNWCFGRKLVECQHLAAILSPWERQEDRIVREWCIAVTLQGVQAMQVTTNQGMLLPEIVLARYALDRSLLRTMTWLRHSAISNRHAANVGEQICIALGLVIRCNWFSGIRAVLLRRKLWRPGPRESARS